VETQEAGMRIINKTGPLHNPADRDHCLQYMIAMGLLFGELTAEHYEDKHAADPRIDRLREKMQVSENLDFSKNYLDPAKRSIGNAIQIFFDDGSATEKVIVEYPIGHRRRREEGIPLLMKKFQSAIRSRFDEKQANRIQQLIKDREQMESQEIDQIVDYFLA